MAREILDKLEPLSEKGYVSQIMVSDRKSTLNDLTQNMNALQTQLETTESQKSQVTQQLAQIEDRIEKVAAESDINISALNEKINLSKLQQSYLIKSPVTGRIDTVLFQRGEIVIENAILATIIPENSNLTAELYIPTDAIGFVETGQHIELRYDAFPYLRFGTAKGEIENVSLSTVDINRFAYSNQSAAYSTFLASARLQSDHFTAYGETIKLKPGMTFEANIVFERRSLIKWLLDPIYAVRKKPPE